MISLALLFCTFLANACCLRTVCYFSNSAQYRSELGNFGPADVNPNMCTHLVFSYVRVLDLGLKPTEWNDDRTEAGVGMYYKYLKLRDGNKDLKVLLALGDFMEGPELYFTAVATDASRATFARNVVTFARNRTFDGVKLEWANLAAYINPRYDKAKFLLLLKAIRAAFEDDSTTSGKPRLILAVTVPAKKRQIDRGYNIPAIAQQSDFISVRAFDMRTAFDRVVGLSSAFRPSSKEQGDERYLNVEWVANYYASMGIPKDKINIGISTFGRSFKLQDEHQYKIGDAAVDFGNVGPWSATIGIVGHYEMCQFILAGGTVVNVPAQGVRYYVSGSEWFSYEDTMSVTQKACFIKQEGFGGITFWTLDLDDFTGKGCREGKYPIIATALRVMSSSDMSVCSLVNSTEYVQALSANKTAVIKPPSQSSGGDKMRLICYYASWAYYRRGYGLFLPESINPDLCTHIVYAYVASEKDKIVPHIFKEESDPWREGLYDRIINKKKVNPALKILISLGGGVGEKFLNQLSDAESIKALALNVVLFLKKKGFDGIELVWETPTLDRKAVFLDLIQALKTAIDDASDVANSRLILAVALPAGRAKIAVFGEFGRDLRTIDAATDYMSIMTYDFHGSWEKHTGLNAPMFEADFESKENAELNMDWTARFYYSMGISKRKMNLGIPTYGRSYTLQDETSNSVYAPVTGAGKAGEYTGTPGLLAYYEVCDLIAHGAEVAYAPEQRVPYAFLDTQWVSFEDVESVGRKACYAMILGFGGVGVWSIDLDDFLGDTCEQGKFPLLTKVYNITQFIEPNLCSNIRMESVSAARIMLPDQHLVYINVILLSVVAFYTA